MKHHGSPITLFSFQDIITGLCGLMILLVLVMLVDVIRRKNTTAAAVPVELTGTFGELETEIADLKTRFAQNEEVLSSAVLTNVTTAIESIQTARTELSDQKKKIQNLESRVAEQELANKDKQARKKATEDLKREQEKIRAALEAAIARYGKDVLTIIPERGIAKMPVYVECSGTEVKIHRPLHNRPTETFSYTQNMKGVFRIADETNPTTSYFMMLIKPSALGYAFALKNSLAEKGFNIGIDPILEETVLNFETAEEGGK